MQGRKLDDVVIETESSCREEVRVNGWVRKSRTFPPEADVLIPM